MSNTRLHSCSYATSWYGPQQSSIPGCGNGRLTSGSPLLGNLSLYAAFTPSDAVAFVQHMVEQAGAAYFDSHAIVEMDNVSTREPDDWNNTIHRGTARGCQTGQRLSLSLALPLSFSPLPLT